MSDSVHHFPSGWIVDLGAGRILHIVPARLLYPSDFEAATPQTPVSSPEVALGVLPVDPEADAHQHSPQTTDVPESLSLRPPPVQVATASTDAVSTAPFSPHGMDRGDLDDELQDRQSSGLSPGAEQAARRSGRPQAEAKAHRRTVSNSQYEFAPAEFDGSVMMLRRVYPSEDEAEPETVPVEVPLVAREQFLVLDAVPQVAPRLDFHSQLMLPPV